MGRKFEGSNFRKSKNFLYLEIFAGTKFGVPAKGSHMNIICGDRGCAENRSKNIEVMAAFYSIDSAVTGYYAYSDSEEELDYSQVML